ncbi:MAG TPA: conjugative transposon protein TraK [Sphingobacterium sp.]|nr:conjugative transposon protein TraK [Sphingobacterium sp.]
MAIIKNLENKIKMATIVSVASLVVSITIVISVLFYTYGQVAESRKTIYILDNGVPILAKQTDQSVNRPVEYKAHVDLFHSLFFNIAPDDKYIEYQMNKAMYLIDESGIQQYNNLKEKGFFSQIMNSSAVLTIQTDSIQLDMANKYFRYYGKQTIDRKSSTVIRSIITEGFMNDIPRTTNNPHGILITKWKTLENRDLSTREKTVL